MSLTRYQKPTSFNITYTSPHLNLAPSAIADNANKNKVLMNDDGDLDWIGFNAPNLLVRLDGSGYIPSSLIPPSFEDLVFYDTVAEFPAIGVDSRWYLTRETYFSYRWNGTSYTEFNVNLSNYWTKTQVDSLIDSAVDSEESARILATTAITNNLNSEIATRISQIANLQTEIDTEETVRANAISAEASTRASAISAEISTRTTQIANLQTEIDAEETARANAISAEASTRASAISSEASTRATAISAEASTRASAISAEASTRATADTNEANARSSADISLQTQITSINSNAVFKNVTGTTSINSNLETTGYLQSASVKTNLIENVAGTDICDITNEGFDMVDGIRFGKYDIVNREAASGKILYKPVFSNNSLVIIGASPTTVYNFDRLIHMYDRLTISHELTTPLINCTTLSVSGAITANSITIVNSTVTGTATITTLSGTTINATTLNVTTVNTSNGGSFLSADMAKCQKHQWVTLAGTNTYTLTVAANWEIYSAVFTLAGTNIYTNIEMLDNVCQITGDFGAGLILRVKTVSKYAL